VSELDDLRALVTEGDRRMLELLNERLELVRRIKEHKAAQGLAFVDPGRERAMLDDLLARNRGPLSAEGLEHFYAELLALVKREL
jgi:chorismate mutase